VTTYQISRGDEQVVGPWDALRDFSVRRTLYLDKSPRLTPISISQTAFMYKAKFYVLINWKGLFFERDLEKTGFHSKCREILSSVRHFDITDCL
jgi:hypothetical protein